MGSVKDIIIDKSGAGALYRMPTATSFGRGGWKVSGRFSVGDLKEQIPDVEIPQQAEALAMMTSRFFEYLHENHPDIPTCYVGMVDARGNIVNTSQLLDRGELSNIVVMNLAHVPGTYCDNDLATYRAALESGKLLCGVADVESIFRSGFPLGSSTFEKIFKATGRAQLYNEIATYDDTVRALDDIRAEVSAKGMGAFPGLEKTLRSVGLTHIPNPGFVLDDIVYNSTTKFEIAGDRDVTQEEEQRFSGLDKEGYNKWTQELFPAIARAQIAFCDERNVLNIDGKVETVAYNRRPVLTDFACTVHENRLMIRVNIGGVEWAVPSNKELQRAIFREQGIYAVRDEAKRRATEAGNVDNWRQYVVPVAKERSIDIRAVAEHSCNLMQYAVAEVGNRLLGQNVFETKPVEQWASDFVPYASKVHRLSA